MLKNNVPINIIIAGREHKNGVIESLTGIENVTIRIRQLSIGDYQVDKRLIFEMINVVYDFEGERRLFVTAVMNHCHTRKIWKCMTF